MSFYTVLIKLDNETIRLLKKDGFKMLVFKGVKSANIGGVLPTVWFTNNLLASQISLSWESNYGGYFSDGDLQSGELIEPTFESPMRAGDVMTYNNGIPRILTKGGVEGSFSIISDNSSEMISGFLAKNPNRRLAPVCAFPQFATMNNLVRPYEKVLILFTQNGLETGTATSTALSVSISIILTNVNNTAEVAFNINKGWDTKGNPQATLNPKNFSLAKDLIIPI